MHQKGRTMMNFYVNVIVKCVVVYFILILALRMMGKREIGELSIFDIVIYLVMSELLAISISNPKESVLHSLVPIIVLSFLQIIISYIILKSKKVRDLIDGKDVLIIENGILRQDRMRLNRYNIDDLLSQMRNQGYFHIKDVAFAVLGTSGELSVLAKNDCDLLAIEPLISDGVVNEEVLQSIHQDKAWLNQQLLNYHIDCIDEVFLCMVEKDGLYIIKRS